MSHVAILASGRVNWRWKQELLVERRNACLGCGKGMAGGKLCPDCMFWQRQHWQRFLKGSKARSDAEQNDQRHEPAKAENTE